MLSIVYGKDISSNVQDISVPNSGHWITEETRLVKALDNLFVATKTKSLSHNSNNTMNINIATNDYVLFTTLCRPG
jgi:hypothetical protein